ncbi:hypothetical protein CS542_08355, partial [Pedobacter sp. IW39]
MGKDFFLLEDNDLLILGEKASQGTYSPTETVFCRNLGYPGTQQPTSVISRYHYKLPDAPFLLYRNIIWKNVILIIPIPNL